MSEALKIPFWGTLLTLLGLMILCALGFWQLERLQWKENLIAQLDQAYESDKKARLDLSQNFSYGRIGGLLLTDKALLLGPRVQDEKMGHDLIVPLKIKDQTLLVNMGWTGEGDVKTLPIHHALNDQVYFTGLLRKPDWNSFTPSNDPENNLWYKADPEEIAQVKALKNISPFILYAESASYKFDAAFPNNERKYPKNNHLQYALFWFSMAGAMIVIYALRFLRR